MRKCLVVAVNFMPHQVAAIDELRTFYDLKLMHYKSTPGGIPQSCSNSINIESLSLKEVFEEIKLFMPDICILAGWGIRRNIVIGYYLKFQTNCRVVTYSDSQFKESVGYKLRSALLGVILTKAFDKIWVPGIYQYEYARNLGFRKKNIIFGSIRVNDFFLAERVRKNRSERLRFIFVGRLVDDKGLNELARAWKSIEHTNCELKIIGDGPLKEMLAGIENVTVLDFMDHNQLKKQYYNSDCFILPSKFEPWGVVVQEAALSGLPLLVSNACGSAYHFVIDGFNGYQFDPNMKGIVDAISRIRRLDYKELLEYGENSREIAKLHSARMGVQILINQLEKQ